MMCHPMLMKWDGLRSFTELIQSIDFILHNPNIKNPANFTLAGLEPDVIIFLFNNRNNKQFESNKRNF